MSNVTDNSTYQCVIEARTKAYMSIYILIILCVISCNLFVLITFRRASSHKRTNIALLIMYLSFFDLFSAVMISAQVYENFTCYRKWLFGEFGCIFVFPLYQISLNMSISILLIMAIDRCHSIIMPMRRKFSRLTIHIAVMISLCLSVFVQWYQFEGLTYTEDDGRQRCRYPKREPKFAIPAIIVLLLRDYTFILIFTVTSILIYVSLAGNDFYESHPNRKRDETKRVVMMLILMEVIFSVLVLPYDIFDIVMLYSRAVMKPIRVKWYTKHIDHILRILQMSNSFVNCFIYAKMHRHLKLRSANSTATVTEYASTKRDSVWSNNLMVNQGKRTSLWSNSESFYKPGDKRNSLWSVATNGHQNNHADTRVLHGDARV